MSRVKIEFEIDDPGVNITDADLKAWLRYELHDNGSIAASNAMLQTPQDLEAKTGTLRIRRDSRLL